MCGRIKFKVKPQPCPKNVCRSYPTISLYFSVEHAYSVSNFWSFLELPSNKMQRWMGLKHDVKYVPITIHIHIENICILVLSSSIYTSSSLSLKTQALCPKYGSWSGSKTSTIYWLHCGFSDQNQKYVNNLYSFCSTHKIQINGIRAAFSLSS